MRAQRQTTVGPAHFGLFLGLLLVFFAGGTLAWLSAARGVTAFFLVPEALLPGQPPMAAVRTDRTGLERGLLRRLHDEPRLDSKVVSEHSTDRFDWPQIAPPRLESSYAVEWRGWLDAPSKGDYRFDLEVAGRAVILV